MSMKKEVILGLMCLPAGKKKKKLYDKLKSKTEMKMNADEFKPNILNCKCGNTDSNGTMSLNSIRRKASGDSYKSGE